MNNQWTRPVMAMFAAAAFITFQAAAQSGPPLPPDLDDGGGSYNNSIPSLPGGGSGGGGTPLFTNYVPTYVVSSNYVDYGNFWLDISNSSSSAYVSVLNSLSNLTYQILTNDNLATTNWGVWQTLLASNSLTPAPPMTVGSTNMFFLGSLVWSTGTNGLPDWWQMEYFGVTGVASNGDYDQDGTDNYNEYVNGTDPNKIQFTAQYTNWFVASSNVGGSMMVAAGVPSYMAILVNNTNFAGASWASYSSNFTFTLGSTNGFYDVWVGLRGLPPTAHQTWRETHFTLYSAPLALVFTNVPGSAVSQPTVPLQGYAPEKLSALSFDVSNALGVLTNQPASVTSQFYDTNLLTFTTNYFQYSVPLASGSNSITLHAADFLGNTLTSNLTVVYVADTNPPGLTLVWPLNSTLIGSSNLTVQAQVSDLTASVSASLNGNTYPGIVEPSGAVWLLNLPLVSGTNSLTLTATGAGGGVNTTNIYIVQGAVNLTINPLTSDQLGQSPITVTGTLSDSAYNVWVDGVEATVTGNTWEADNVSVNTTGTAVITAQAGANPTNLVAQQTLDQVQPPLVAWMSYFEETHTAYYDDETCSDYAGNTYYHNKDETIHWYYTSGGTEANAEYGLNGDNEKYNTSYENSISASDLSSWITSPRYANAYIDDLDASCGMYLTTGPLQEQSQLMIVPSGQTAGTGTNLYLVSASANEYSDPLNATFGSLSGDVPLPPAWLQIQGQPLTNNIMTNDDDGTIWGSTLIAVPANTMAMVTPVATQNYSNNVYSFNVQAQNVGFQITVLSNSATQIDATNWAAVETNDYVTIQAVISDSNAIPFLTWTGGQAVSGNPLLRQVSKTVSTNVMVKATLGAISSSINIWVIWANLTIKTTGTLDLDDKAALLVSNNWPTPMIYNVTLSGGNGLGGSNGLGSVDCLSDTNLNYAYTAGKMEAKAILQPSGIGALLTNNWDMKRTRIVIAWDNGGSPSVSNPPPGTDDTSSSGEKYLNPINGDIFDLDAPGCSVDLSGTNINHTAEVYDNFYEYVTVNLGGGNQTCSNTNTWSYSAQVDVDATNKVQLNSLSTSLITLPSTSHYTHR